MDTAISPHRLGRRMLSNHLIVAGLAATCLMFPAAAQSQKVTRADYAAAHKFSDENLKTMLFDLTVTPEWIGRSDRFWYRWETGAGVEFYSVDPARKSVRKVFDNAALAARLSALLSRPVDPAHLPIDSLAFSQDEKTIQFAAGNAAVEYNRATGAVRKLPDSALADETSPYNAAQMKLIRDFTGGGTLKGVYLYSPDGRWAVCARNYNLYVMDAKDPARTEYPLSRDGEPWYSFDLSNESGAKKDQASPAFVTWLPGSSKFFIKRSDRRKVRELWLLQPLTRPFPTLRTYKNALAGDEYIDQHELWVFDCARKSGIKIKAEKWKDQAIGGKAQDGGVYSVADSPNLYFIRTDRTWSRIDFCEADTETGDVRTIISEELKPNVTPTSSQAKVLNKGRDIVWWSDRDGWGHFYLYDGDGHLKNRITSGPFCCRSIVRVDPVTRTLFFTAEGKEEGVNPYYEFLYRIGLDGKGLKRLTPENADHAVESLSMSETGRYFVENHSRVDLAPRAVVRDSAGNAVAALEPPDISRLTAAGWKPPETFKVKAADDATDLYGVMWKPFGLDPKLKYPIILITYPGPISEAIPKDFNPLSMFSTGLSQLGFVVVMFGNRGGSAERAKWYNTYGYGNLRDYSLEDKKKGLERLAELYPFIDIDRVGVMGGSGGGFQSTTLMFTYADFFKVGVCWAGNNDNSLMENYWPELNQGVREIQDPKGTRFEVKTPDNMELAKNLKGHYLIMHGLQDARVHISSTYRIIQALIEANRPFDMYVIPDEQHQMTRAKYLPYIMRIIWHYFAANLMGDPRSLVEVFDQYDSPVMSRPWRHH